ncbi:hypothetical protein C8Q77DRAFT_856289 [Trametes polyzona]|nr:hypothetical protein C8Q77DRAFT_856289 [Trametes polyzona]
MTIPPSGPSRTESLIESKFRSNTLISMDQISTALDLGLASNLIDCMYAVKTFVEGLKLMLAVDTGSPIIWYYQEGVIEVVIPKRGDFKNIKFTDNPWENNPLIGYRKKLPCIFNSPQDSEDVAYIEYADGSLVGIARYPLDDEHSVHARIPSWDWKRSKRDADIQVVLPRVVAVAANLRMTQHPFDGILGFGVPGYTEPFDQRSPTTLYEALRAGGHIDKPMQLTIRLLHPGFLAVCPNNVQSYAFYGNHWPCAYSKVGVDPSSGRHRGVPRFTPPLYVIPTEITPVNPSYGLWASRLISMTLLVPKVPRSTMQTPVPWRDNLDDFTPYKVEMPTETQTSATTGSVSALGIAVVLDTGSSHSSFPRQVYEAIGTHWLGIPPPQSEEEAYSLYCPKALDLDDRDIIFTFQGDDGNPVDFRCGASRFLRSPFRFPKEGVDAFDVPIHTTEQFSTSDISCCLGQNFFWTAFVRLDCEYRGPRPVPGDSRVQIRLAPQRVKNEKGNVINEFGLGFHSEPRDVEAFRAGRSIFAYNDE